MSLVFLDDCVIALILDNLNLLRSIIQHLVWVQHLQLFVFWVVIVHQVFVFGHHFVVLVNLRVHFLHHQGLVVYDLIIINFVPFNFLYRFLAQCLVISFYSAVRQDIILLPGTFK